MIARVEIWCADMPEAAGSAPDFRRSVLVMQSDAFNRSKIATGVCVALTGNQRWESAPGNVLLPAKVTGLERDSVANMSQIVSLDRTELTSRVGKLPRAKLEAVLFGIDVVLGR